MHPLHRYGIILVVSVAGLVGCQSVKVQELPANADPAAEITKTEAALNAAATRQLDVASPSNFAAAKKALADAKKYRDDGRDNETVLHQVALAQGYLQKADQVGAIEQASMSDVLQARQAAVAAEAPKVDHDKFEKLDADLRDIGAKAEDNDLSRATKEHAELADNYSKLELDAIKTTQLRRAKGDVDQAIKEGAKKEAPQTLDAARHAITTAEQYIDSNRHDAAGIAQRVAQANADAKHALDVTRAVKVTAKTRPESVVLQEEAEKARLAQEQTALAAQQAKATSLGATNSRLQQEQQTAQTFEQGYTAAKAAFSPTEAEVLRDGNRLVIRLKALTFPSGKATIPASDYALLGKVQGVIKAFRPTAIEIQGHTDSTGRAAKNQILSEQRAHSVQDYLASNGALGNASVSAVGYGDSRPIASNRDASGRAQNRRIDLILTPAVGQTAH